MPIAGDRSQCFQKMSKELQSSTNRLARLLYCRGIRIVSCPLVKIKQLLRLVQDALGLRVLGVYKSLWRVPHQTNGHECANKEKRAPMLSRLGQMKKKIRPGRSQVENGSLKLV